MSDVQLALFGVDPKHIFVVIPVYQHPFASEQYTLNDGLVDGEVLLRPSWLACCLAALEGFCAREYGPRVGVLHRCVASRRPAPLVPWFLFPPFVGPRALWDLSRANSLFTRAMTVKPHRDGE